MKDRRGDALVTYSIMTKLLPLGFAIIMLFTLSESFKQFSPYSDPLPIFYGYFLGYTGIVVFLEALFVAPHSKIALGGLAFGLLLFLSASNFIFAGLLLTNTYDSLSFSFLNGWLTITLVVGVIMYVYQAREELVHKRRFADELKRKLYG